MSAARNSALPKTRLAFDLFRTPEGNLVQHETWAKASVGSIHVATIEYCAPAGCVFVSGAGKENMVIHIVPESTYSADVVHPPYDQKYVTTVQLAYMWEGKIQSLPFDVVLRADDWTVTHSFYSMPMKNKFVENVIQLSGNTEMYEKLVAKYKSLQHNPADTSPPSSCDNSEPQGDVTETKSTSRTITADVLMTTLRVVCKSRICRMATAMSNGLVLKDRHGVDEYAQMAIAMASPSNDPKLFEKAKLAWIAIHQFDANLVCLILQPKNPNFDLGKITISWRLDCNDGIHLDVKDITSPALQNTLVALAYMYRKLEACDW